MIGKKELVALLDLSSWCLVMVGWLFLTLPWGCLLFVIVVFPDHTHLLFFHLISSCSYCCYLCHVSLLSKSLQSYFRLFHHVPSVVIGAMYLCCLKPFIMFLV